MKKILYTILAVAAISSCAPTGNTRANNESIEANAPDDFNPSSVSPRSEARYGINFSGNQAISGDRIERESDPFDVVRADASTSTEASTRSSMSSENTSEDLMRCEVYSVEPEVKNEE